MGYVLGIDGGASKTVCLVVDEAGKTVSRGEAGPSNYHSVGQSAALASIQAAIAIAVKPLGAITLKAIGLGLAGIARPQDNQVVYAWVQQLQASSVVPITWSISEPNIVITHDALTALVGGITQAEGIVVNAGTGSIIFGRNQQGVTKRVGGWGPILGDEGSAYWIALRGMRAALLASEGQELPTQLQELFRQHLGLQTLAELVKVYQPEWGVKEIAALAPIVDRAAVIGDEVAQSILEQAAQALFKGTQLVRNSIFSAQESVRIVTLGSVWKSQYEVRARFEALVKDLPLTTVVFPQHEPSYGAALLALRTL